MIMVKLSELPTGDEIHERHMREPEYAREIERTRFANEVALAVLKYRAEHGLTQTGLARMLGMRQPHIARLEAADHEPSLAMLARLSKMLGIDFSIDITPDRLELRTRRHKGSRPLTLRGEKVNA
ncbi:MAG TPA: helix-turn-helix transcriptional regulator [Streptosporangiaceae bacterium]|jgi:ribosome-binding protein aMBF1 (putative translation factor)|nr:helix-turn-helix transcriptional regulator [Streptosporangiaceae bacterium]